MSREPVARTDFRVDAFVTEGKFSSSEPLTINASLATPGHFLLTSNETNSLLSAVAKRVQEAVEAELKIYISKIETAGQK